MLSGNEVRHLNNITDALAGSLEFYAQRDCADIARRVTACIQIQASKLLPR